MFERTGLIIGGLICAGVLLQLVLLTWTSLRRIVYEAKSRQLQLELMRRQIDAARRKRVQSSEAEKAWEGWRKFEVMKKVIEARDTASIYLKPHDNRNLPSFHPGQYLTFQLAIPGQPKAVTRCYSLSDGPREDYYRVTVKKVPPPRDKPDLPSGRSSTFFNEVVKEGDILDVKAPHGAFYLDMATDHPVVLIGGGIGITPVLSMLNGIVACKSQREVWFFLGVRGREDHPFKEHLEAIAAEHDNLRLHICYSDPGKKDVEGKDYHHGCRVSADLFKKVLPSNNYHYYLCGPGPFMESIVKGLEDWGVPEADIHFEAFGPASVKKVKAAAPAETTAAPTGEVIEVTFAKSDKKLKWDGKVGNLLELAEANGIMIDSGCRAGNCGTCITAIKSGKVKYPKDTGVEVEAGSCLACIGMPDGPVSLDA
ncbi:MAG: 2Fe-2S iron-sulfur cluster binding domain-containing protein [Planctomycetes bacterium]|nr:2Fe-2S iron-sulfur cluster binding domain-containing protein [Planctomycetota bacterium]